MTPRRSPDPRWHVPPRPGRDLPPRPSAARAVTLGGCGRPRPRRTPMSITLVRLRRSHDRVLYDEEGASTAEYAINVLAAMNELGHNETAVPLDRTSHV